MPPLSRSSQALARLHTVSRELDGATGLAALRTDTSSVSASDPEAFHAGIRMLPLVSTTVTKVTMSAHSGARRPRRGLAPADDRLDIVLLVSGSADVTVDGRRSSDSAGTVRLLRARHVVEYVCDAEVRAIVVRAPMAALAPGVEQRVRASGVTRIPRSVLTRATIALAIGMFSGEADRSDELHHLERVLLGLIGSTITDALASGASAAPVVLMPRAPSATGGDEPHTEVSRPSAPIPLRTAHGAGRPSESGFGGETGPASDRDPLGSLATGTGEIDRDAIIAVRAASLIAAHHAERDFSLERLAALLGTSTRTVQRVFTNRATTMGIELRRTRVDAIRAAIDADLATGSNTPLGELVERCGYERLGHAGRAFRAVTGGTLSAYRAAAIARAAITS